MSVDWSILCDKCSEYCHLGQDTASGASFGYGSQDIDGRESAGEFISDHLDHNRADGESLRIVITDNIPNGYAGHSYET